MRQKCFRCFKQDEIVAAMLKAAGIIYARTVNSTKNFELLNIITLFSLSGAVASYSFYQSCTMLQSLFSTGFILVFPLSVVPAVLDSQPFNTTILKFFFLVLFDKCFLFYIEKKEGIEISIVIIYRKCESLQGKF